MLSTQNVTGPFEFVLIHSIQNGGVVGGSDPLPTAGYVHCTVFQPSGVWTVTSGPFTVPPPPTGPLGMYDGRIVMKSVKPPCSTSTSNCSVVPATHCGS